MVITFWSFISDFDDFPAVNSEPLDISLPLAHSNDPFLDVPKGLNDTLNDEPSSDYEALVQKWVSDYVTSAQVFIFISC